MWSSIKSRMLNNENKPWNKQSFAKKEKNPSVKEIVELAGSIENDRDRCLFVLTYLTAGRLQEIVKYKGKGEERSSIKIEDLSITQEKGRKILLINLRNNKHRKRHRKDLPVPLDIPENALLYDMMVGYLSSFSETDEIFPISYRRAYAILTRINPGWNPHWIRHIRLTHLVTEYGYKEFQLMLYAGWTDPRPAKDYLQMRWEDLLY